MGALAFELHAFAPNYHLIHFFFSSSRPLPPSIGENLNTYTQERHGEINLRF